MNIKQYILKILSDKSILELLPDERVYHIHANNPNPPYVEYQVINEYGVEYEENKEKYTRYIIQIDIFSKKDYTEIENVIKKHMFNAGFERDMAADLYEEKTGLYHKGMRFSIDLPTSEN
ncbi:prohead protease [Anaerosalibacter bizertensis]|uniref:Prohead protease n=1 Tax=Anaerosalibacter bizertensis TaxID=932217 RepID=A0A844FGR6_9FIRM|nr:hypothetical protein [Anaerosalibacter bizertensis]MSS43164.1 prohead protease [Anaerosalibacter bizertensis]